MKIAGNELRALFCSPVAWFILVIFAVQAGMTFTDLFKSVLRQQFMGEPIEFSITNALLTGMTGTFTVIQQYLYLYVPLLTMGLMSREFGSGSIKLLYSSPVTAGQIIWGKFLSMMIYGLILMGVLLVLVIFASCTVEAFDIPAALSGLLGLYLLTCAYAAIGLYMSCLTSYQVVAAVGTLAVLIVLIPWIVSVVHPAFLFVLDDWLYRALVFLVISCPCALVVSIPLGYFGGIGAASRLGILFKGGNYLDAITKINTVVFDKTGTLTEGKPRLLAAESFDPLFDEERILGYAASLEGVSEHPLALAVTSAAEERNLHLYPVSDFASVSGLGVSGNVDLENESIPLLLGNKRLMEERQVSFDAVKDLDARLAELSDSGATPLLLAVSGRLVGMLAVADTIRPETAGLVKELRQLGLRVIMLSGDNRRTAEAIAKSAGIDEVIADVLPDGKEKVISELQAAGLRVGMIGDGINDAPALARADVGMAMGNGIDVAVEAGDIVLLGSDTRSGKGLRGVVTALELSRAALRNIRENLGWAFGYNILCLPIAAGVLKIFGGPSLSPMIAGAAMAFSSVSVVLNALRLRRFGK